MCYTFRRWNDPLRRVDEGHDAERLAEGMWDFLREQLDHVPRPLRLLFVIAFLLAGLNRLNKIEFQPQLEECLSQPGIVGCIGLGIAASPYLVLIAGLLCFVLLRFAASIRRWLRNRRRKGLLKE